MNEKQMIDVSFVVDTFYGNGASRKLSDLAESLVNAQNKLGVPDDARVRVDVEFDPYEDNTIEEIHLEVTYQREETDAEYNKRLAKERRERATSAAFAERKKARDILRLREEAKRLGFVIALPTDQ